MLKVRASEMILVTVCLVLTAVIITFSVIDNSKTISADVSYDTSAVTVSATNLNDAQNTSADSVSSTGTIRATSENITTAVSNVATNKTESTKFTGVLNINTASAEDLQQLSGIGEVIANKIVQYRTDNGGFSDIEEIKNVSGIGEKKFEAIKEHISIK